MITLRSLLIVGVLALAYALPSSATAEPGYATGNVNLRTGPGSSYHKILVVPAGARLNVFRCSSWCRVNYRGHRGWVFAKYVAAGRSYRRPAPFYRSPPPRFGYYRRPWWDDRYRAWYDGRRWYRDGRWYNHPNAFFYFRFGR
jgi:uncharacterized protein YraI